MCFLSVQGLSDPQSLAASGMLWSLLACSASKSKSSIDMVSSRSDTSSMSLNIMSSSTSAKYSSKPKPHGTLAAQLDVLRELVNLGDGDVERFRQKYPDFVPNVFAQVIWTKAALEHLERSGDRIVSPRALLLAETLKSSGPKAE